MSRIELGSMLAEPVVVISASTSSGVTNTPRMLENDALTTAPATLPRAMEVKAIEDWTVEGTRQRNSTPV
jgi:hypothetical protein